MTTADTSHRVAPPSARLSLDRRVYALMGAAGVVAIAVLRLVVPYSDTDSVTAAIAKVAVHTGREQLVVILGAIGVALLIPGYQALARLTQDAAPRLTRIALTLSYVGYLALGIDLLGDQLLLSTSSLTDQPGAVELAKHVLSSPFVTVIVVIFVVGHILGTVLLGGAFLRTRSIPTWAAVLVIVSQPLHFVAAIILGNHVMDFCCWLLLAVGFSVAGATLISRRGSPDEQ